MGPRALTRLAWPLVWLLMEAACAAPRAIDRSPAPAHAAREARAAPAPGAPPSKDLFLVDDPPGPRTGPARQRLLGEWPARAARVRLAGHKEPVRAVLARLAAVSRLNFVLADEVQGELTTSLEEVPWTEALGALLAAKDLVAVREGNVVRVLRREDHAREAGLSP